LKSIVYLIAVILLGSYASDPIYLNNLCDNSEIIIDANIVFDSIYESKNEIYAEAVLKVNRLVKGELTQNEITVTYDPTWSCPEGPTFDQGRNVVAFLNYQEDQYYVNGMSYGTKYFNAKKLRDEYISRIEEYLLIKKEPKVDSMKIVSWLIDNLDYETTKNETTFIISNSLQNEEALLQGTNKRSWPYKPNVFPITKIWNESQKIIIRNKIMNEEIAPRRYSWKLLCHLYNSENKEFEDFMIQKLPEYLEKEYFYGLVDIIDVINFEDKKLVELKNEILSIPAKRENYPKLHDLIRTFYEQIK